MLTKLTIRNFKMFGTVEIELGERVVLIGPNNSGKTTALQALALWEAGLKRWVERRGAGPVPKKRSGVTINRQDLTAVPVPTAKLLWRDLHVREGRRDNGKQRTENVLISIEVEGISEGKMWVCGLEFDYANEESFYCRPLPGADGTRMPVPKAAANIRLAFLPPMSGLSATETSLTPGAINVMIGEGKTADVLRNLCYGVLIGEDGENKWKHIVKTVHNFFGVDIEKPKFISERGEIIMSYKDRRGISLDISASGRGQQQTLLLLAHMAANPGSVLLLDEPDAHLEIIRQRQIYDMLTREARSTRNQIIAASHSEVILNEAVEKDIVIAFVGKPHRIDDRGSQVLKALTDIGFESYYQAEEMGWVLYLEGSTDLAILRAFADRLSHPAGRVLDHVFVHYVGNQPSRARDHFHGLREAMPDLPGIAVFDRLEREPSPDPHMTQYMWRRREIENYLTTRETLVAYARAQGREQGGELFAQPWGEKMAESIDEIESALATIGRPSPWGGDLKVSDEFLAPVFKTFYEKLGLPNLMNKAQYHELAPFVPREEIADDIQEMLDRIRKVAGKAKSRRDETEQDSEPD